MTETINFAPTINSAIAVANWFIIKIRPTRATSPILSFKNCSILPRAGVLRILISRSSRIPLRRGGMGLS